MNIFDYFKKTEYLYHGTCIDNISNIRIEGLNPTYFTREVIFLSDNPGFSAFWGKLGALIRIKKRDLKPEILKKTKDYNGEYQYSETIHPKLLEIRRVSMNKDSGNLELSLFKHLEC